MRSWGRPKKKCRPKKIFSDAEFVYRKSHKKLLVTPNSFCARREKLEGGPDLQQHHYQKRSTRFTKSSRRNPPVYLTVSIITIRLGEIITISNALRLTPFLNAVFITITRSQMHQCPKCRTTCYHCQLSNTATKLNSHKNRLI